jgi:hypothetical protein
MSCYVLLKNRGDGVDIRHHLQIHQLGSPLNHLNQPLEKEHLSGKIPNSPEKFGQLGDPSPKPIPIVPVTSQASGVIICHLSNFHQLPHASNNVPQLPAPNLHALWQMWMSSPDDQVGPDHSWIQGYTPKGVSGQVLDPSGLLIFHCHHFRLFLSPDSNPYGHCFSRSHYSWSLYSSSYPYYPRENQR